MLCLTHKISDRLDSDYSLPDLPKESFSFLLPPPPKVGKTGFHDTATTLESRPRRRQGAMHTGPSMLDAALDTTDQHDAFRQALTDHGIRCALELLNDRTSYRFTAIYKLVGSVLRAQYAYDRACEYRTWLMVVPLERSFCQYAIESGEFMTSCVSKDPRLAKRPYAGMVEAYYGQLLVRPDGTPYGTFIHFDLESRSIAADEIEFLREAVPLFMKQLA